MMMAINVIQDYRVWQNKNYSFSEMTVW